MEWRLLDESGEFLTFVNCQYDACDIAAMVYGADKVSIDFNKQEAKILSRSGKDEKYNSLE